MKEDFLHYLWKYQKFSAANLQTIDHELIQVLKVGSHNTQSDGPDFFAAQLIIDNQKWAGNVEIHIKSSDWFAHKHQTDANYDSVILHVVWEYDVDVYRQNDTKIPVLELKQCVSAEALSKYQQLYANTKKRWINCENQLSNVSSFVWENWLERLYFERLEEKCAPISALLLANTNNWETTCFCLIAKAFGGNTNGEAFFRMAQSIPFAIIQKEISAFKLEALFFGQANLLNETTDDSFEKSLYTEYTYLKKKYQLVAPKGIKLQFYRLRPPNFPTIRLSQLAVLYANNTNFFNRLSELKTIRSYRELFQTKTSAYWDTHYNFGKATQKSLKKTTATFIDGILLNAVIPLRFLHMQSKGYTPETIDDLLDVIRIIQPEKNSIVNKYQQSGVNVSSALVSQSLLTLYKNYCTKDKCLHCFIGVSLLGS